MVHQPSSNSLEEIWSCTTQNKQETRDKIVNQIKDVLRMPMHTKEKKQNFELSKLSFATLMPSKTNMSIHLLHHLFYLLQGSPLYT